MKPEDVLHRAADHHLRSPEDEDSVWSDRTEYSCDAVSLAIFGGAAWWGRRFDQKLDQEELQKVRLSDQIFRAMAEMGMNRKMQDSLNVYAHFSYPDAQGARYLWLKWVALMFEEGVVQ